MLQCNKNCCFIRSSFILNESRILNELPEGRVIVLDTIPSTNQYILDNIQYIKSGDVFVTDCQTQGRGRYGKCWITPNKQSVCLSIYWKMYRNLCSIVELSLIISFSVAVVLKKLGVSQIKIKWPNDLYIGDRKLAGILIETITNDKNIFHLAIGIGINISICVHTQFNIHISKDWIDLKNIGVNLNRNILVSTLVIMLRKTLNQFSYNQNVPCVNCQPSLNYLYNKSIELFGKNNIYRGTVLGINSRGLLLVMDNFGKVHYYNSDNLSIRVL